MSMSMSMGRRGAEVICSFEFTIFCVNNHNACRKANNHNTEITPTYTFVTTHKVFQSDMYTVLEGSDADNSDLKLV